MRWETRQLIRWNHMSIVCHVGSLVSICWCWWRMLEVGYVLLMGGETEQPKSLCQCYWLIDVKHFHLACTGQHSIRNIKGRVTLCNLAQLFSYWEPRQHERLVLNVTNWKSSYYSLACARWWLNRNIKGQPMLDGLT